MRYHYNDGGRALAGYTGSTGDCVVRAIAIATEQPYQTVYDAVNAAGQGERRGKRKRGVSNARTGVYKQTIRKYLTSLGWTWTPTMHIGSGCQVHLADGELPGGRLIVSVSRHLTAVIDGVVHDTHDPQRQALDIYGGTPVLDADGHMRNPVVGKIGGRCVYGYFKKK